MAFRLDKLTVKSQEAVQRAQSLASEKGHPEMDPLHLLAALLAEAEGVVGPRLASGRWRSVSHLVRARVGSRPSC